MKVDGGLAVDKLDNVAEDIQRLEALGYDGALTAELAHDPFFPLVLAAEHSEKIELRTSIAVAFARSPMILANIGHDLNHYSKGRFTLGIGSQIKPHITKRFSMPWHDKPAPQMRELIQSMRAIWANWYEQKPLEYTGKFYHHTLMTPMFTPKDTEYGAPKIALAAVGPKMTEVAAEVADGMIVHSFNTAKYLQETILPAINRTLEKHGRKREDFEISYPMFVVSGENEEEMLRNRQAVCKQLAFYGSTPAYKRVLDTHGWGDLQPELNRLSKQGKWDEMGTLITDDILDAFAVVGELDEIPALIKQRFGGLVDRVTIGYSAAKSETVQKQQIAKLQSA